MRTASADLLAARTVTVDGSEVWLRVTASPVDLEIRWCGGDRLAGSPVLFPAGDRSRRLLGAGLRAGTTFSLDVVGEQDPDWSGVVDWNV
ncbi:hypothetical protein V1227_18290 [Lentzea sp. DG1S-22]|uniref:hypothetical protein n=1 Tax=Lentzea sp. DG1S-22 TaxID=3108822 RepID=UPI002E767E60|nr:hypothetical protein [Lentzea sp. DG1S-22]WVH84610.1 hypothetical protein V1227_18290 [Lentzea sp. DG1S-22]